MKNVVLKSSCLFFMTLVFTLAYGQNKSDQLQAEQKKLEKKLSSTKSLLNQVKKSTSSSLNELRLIDTQVKSREALVQNVDNQIRSSELTIQSKGNQVKQLEERIQRLKAQYKKLILYAYKHRNKYGKMMYIFSSNNYFEAVKRNSYLKQIAEIQKKQFKLIQLNHKKIHHEIEEIGEVKKNQEVLLKTKLSERDLILKDKQKKEQSLAKLKKDEGQLLADLKDAEKQKSEIQKKIKKAIEAEIAAEAAKEKKAKEAKEAKEVKSSTASKPTTTITPKTTTTTPDKKELVNTETKESAVLSKSFETNKGKLPWPVLKGTVVEAYGKNPHPTLSGVFTNNNGIDIGAPKSAQVRAVFEGEVTSVISITGAGKCVIIKHGNYRTVYSNLQEVYVSVGTKVSTKQSVGSLLPESGSDLSTAHFEIHQVADGTVVKLNPSLWLAQ